MDVFWEVGTHVIRGSANKTAIESMASQSLDGLDPETKKLIIKEFGGSCVSANFTVGRTATHGARLEINERGIRLICLKGVKPYSCR